MDKTEAAVHNMLSAIEAPLYDVGVLSNRGMLPDLNGIPASVALNVSPCSSTAMSAVPKSTYARPGTTATLFATISPRILLVKIASDGFTARAVVETRAGNFQAWLKHPTVFPN
jgi:hypothetical protein